MHNGYPETSRLFFLPLQQNSSPGLHQLPLQKNKDQTPICFSICSWICTVPQYLEVSWSEVCREHNLPKPGGSQLISFLMHCFLNTTLHTMLAFSPSQRCPLRQKRHFVSIFLLKNCHAVSAICNKCLCLLANELSIFQETLPAVSTKNLARDPELSLTGESGPSHKMELQRYPKSSSKF